MTDYTDFLRTKELRADKDGLDTVPPVDGRLFPFQRHCVEFALRRGRAGIFLDTGLGKTLIQLEWAKHAAEASNGKALILTPLAVARQIEREGQQFGYPVQVVRDQSQVRDGISVCNYDRIGKLDCDAFGAVSLDEASILKSFAGKTKQALLDSFAGHRWKVAATATPAPNDHMELGNYAEFMNVLSATEMLSRFFINDASKASQEWRLKHHAVDAFWDWMASWSRMAEKPTDLGDDMSGFDLPPLNIIRHRSRDSAIKPGDGDLFASTTMSATTMHDVKRQTVKARAEKVAGMINGEAWILWCDTNYEADAIKAAVPDAIEIRGSQSIDQKEENLDAFVTGQAPYLIAKPSMCGHGLNLQHCNHMAFVGRSYSYEVYYQAVRRCWRYGQKLPVNVHLIVAEGEAEIGRVIDRKAGGHADMKKAMKAAMLRNMGTDALRKTIYNPQHQGDLPEWIRSAV